MVADHLRARQRCERSCVVKVAARVALVLVLRGTDSRLTFGKDEKEPEPYMKNIDNMSITHTRAPIADRR